MGATGGTRFLRGCTACAACSSRWSSGDGRRVVWGVTDHDDACGDGYDDPAALLAARPAHVAVLEARDVHDAVRSMASVLTRFGGPRRLVLLATRRPAPEIVVAFDDGDVASLVVSGDRAHLVDLEGELYAMVETLLGPGPHVDVAVAQLPAEAGDTPSVAPERSDRAAPATWVIPHRGALDLLEGCLDSVAGAAGDDDDIQVCFDEPVSEEHRALVARHPRVTFHAVTPPAAGPYLPRQVLAERATTPLIAWQDSDDRPTIDRLAVLEVEQQATGAAMVGGQELVVDTMARRLRVRRYALDPTVPLHHGLVGGMAVEGSVVTTAAFRALGGYATDLRFGADTQFLLRASLTRRLSNVNEILNVSRLRPDSLTTGVDTGFASSARRIQILTFKWHYANVRRGVLALDRSALVPGRVGGESERLRPIRAVR
ncbi:MAG: glycosyltransferase family 2 protein [Acidimicrobiales bacterium]|nr:glycosyltransferase family 2 protein [Acidimicrobiales bacterium]